MRYARCCLLGVLSGLSTLLAQNSIGVALPAKPPDQEIVSVPKYNPEFRKNLTVESFGYSLAPVSKGYEFLQPTLSSGPWTTHGLECPRCITRSPMERMRYTLPPFGTTITKSLWNDRVEI